MECPHCHRQIPDTAVRCRHCRRAVKERRRRGRTALRKFLRRADIRLKVFLSEGMEPSCPWTMLDVAAITAIIAVFVVSDPFQLGLSIFKFLRLNFVSVIREPKLLYYLTHYINTIALKVVSLVFLIVLVRSRRVSFWNTVVSGRKDPELWEAWLPLYIGMCILMREVNMANPLIPHIPFNSVFPEARIAGNVVIIFAVLFVAPFIEEVLFRGFLYPAFNRYMGIYPAIILTSLLFAFAHYPQIRESYSFMAVIFVLSLVITYVRARTGSTWIAIIMHHIYNLVSVGMGFVDYLIYRY